METVQTIKTEDEKLVPIDTSGKSVDVELKDEVQKESNVKEVESNITVVEEENQTTPTY